MTRHAPLDFRQLEFVYLELSVKCNLRCHFCDNSMRNLYRDIAPDQFRYVIDQLRSGTRLGLHGLGEPTLHKQLIDLIAHAKARGLYVYFNTNHTTTTDEQMRGFVEHELDELRISMSAASRQTFASYAGQDLFEALLERMARMVEIRGAHSRPLLRTVFVMTLQSYPEFPAVLKLATDLGMDEVMVQTYLDWGKPTSADEPDAGCRLDDSELTVARRSVVEAARAASGIKVVLPFPVDGSAPAPGEPGQCRWPFNAVWITSAGDVTPCCNLHDPRQILLGNAFEAPLDSIWLGEAYSDFRRRYRADAVTACHSCPVHCGQFKSYAYGGDTR